jgi:hypothetical protein
MAAAMDPLALLFSGAWQFDFVAPVGSDSSFGLVLGVHLYGGDDQSRLLFIEGRGPNPEDFKLA